jgi:hypothetical protein
MHHLVAYFLRNKDLSVCCRREENSRSEQAICVPSPGADAQTEHRVDGSEFFLCLRGADETISSLAIAFDK